MTVTGRFSSMAAKRHTALEAYATPLQTCHLTIAIMGVVGMLKGPTNVAPHVLLTLACCLLLRLKPFSAPARWRLVATLTALAFLWRMSLVLRFCLGVTQVPDIALKGYHYGYIFITEAFVTTLESVYLLSLLPGPAATALTAAHLSSFILAGVQRQACPPLPVCMAFVVLLVVTPHLLLKRMDRSTHQQQQQQHASDVQQARGRALQLQQKLGMQAISRKGDAEGSCSAGGRHQEKLDKVAVLSATAEPQWQADGQMGSSPEEHTGALPLVACQADACTLPRQQQPPVYRASPSTPAEAVPVVASSQAAAVPMRSSSRRNTSSALCAAPSNSHSTLPLPMYRSHLSRTKVVIKVPHMEPQHLPGDVIAGITSVIGNQLGPLSNARVVAAAVRRGCTLLLVEVADAQPNQAPDPQPAAAAAAQWATSEQGHQDLGDRIMTGDGTLQALLGALTQGPETPPVPEGCTAHVCVNDQLLEVSWQQGRWVVAPSPSASVAMSLSLVYVDHVVARLPTQQAALAATDMGHNEEPGSRPASQALPKRHHHHHVSLLLQCQGLPADLSFIGSDACGASSAGLGSEHGSPVAAAAAHHVSCVARGSWASFLPVDVVGWDTSDGGGLAPHRSASLSDLSDTSPDSAEGAQARRRGAMMLDSAMRSSLISLTLDVDLADAPHAGAVQLELWQGHTLLVSAPLLLLPCADPPVEPDTTTPAGTDPLMDEMQLVVRRYSWQAQEQEQGGDDEGMGEGGSISAWLSDLGQVLHASAVIQQHTGSSAAAPPASAQTGPGTWGGIATSMARQYANDPVLITNIRKVAQGVQEFAQQEGLPCVEALVVACTATLRARHGELTATRAASPSPAQEQGEHSSRTPLGTQPHDDEAQPSGKPRRQNTSEVGLGGGPSSSKANGAAEPAAKHGKGTHAKHAQAAGSSPGFSANSAHPIGQQASSQPSSRDFLSLPAAQAVQAMLRGFEPSVEQQYTAWLAVETASLVSSITLLQLIQLAACAARTAALPGGLRALLLSEFPVYLLHIIPQVIILLLLRQEGGRWKPEAGFLLHALIKTCTMIATVSGVLPWPSTFSAGYRAGLDVWGDIFVYGPAKPTRLPVLLAMNALFLACNLMLCHLHEGLESTWLCRALLPRLGATLVGAACDVYRRSRFLQAAHVTGGAVARATASSQPG